LKARDGEDYGLISANRGKYHRDRLRYRSDLTDAEWELVEPLIPPAERGGRRREVDVR